MAGLSQKGLPVPSMFGGHLGEQEATMGSLDDKESVPAYRDFLDVLNLLQGGKDRDLDLEFLEFLLAEGREARVGESCRDGTGGYCLVEGIEGFGISDAATEKTPLL